MAYATVYEQSARFYHATVLGMDDISRFGYGLRAMHAGQPGLIYPAPTKQLQNIKIPVARRTDVQKTQAQHGETARSEFKNLMPRSIDGGNNASRAQVPRPDIHGNPLLQPKYSESIKLEISRSSADQRLYADTTQIEDLSGTTRLAACPGNHVMHARRAEAGSESALYTATKQDMMVAHRVLQFIWATTCFAAHHCTR
ncbi:hypothetical protein BDV10DRAFT_188641 [Aspergillus recurvatus]